MSRHNCGKLMLFMVVCALLTLAACSGGGGNNNADGDVQSEADSEVEMADSDSGEAEPDGDQEQPGEADIETDGDAEPDIDEEADVESDGDNDGDFEPEKEHQAGATLEIEPNPVGFDSIELGGSGEEVVSLRNIQEEEGGQVALTVSSFALTTSSSKDIRIADGCATPFELAADAVKDCSLICAPTTPMQKTATLRIVSSDGINDPVEQRISVTCGVVHPISYVDPKLLEFGFTPKGMRQTLRFFVANPASINLDVADVRLSDDTPESFSLSFPERALREETLAPNELVEVELSYLPTANVNEFGMLEIESNDPYVPLRSIPISGRSYFACRGDTPNLEGDSCVDVCIPGQRKCEYDENNDAYFVTACAEDGSEWLATEDCADGLICLDGYCILKACEASALMCRGNGVLSCAEDELGFVEEDDCGSSDLCTERTCTPGVGCGEEDTSLRCNDQNACTDDTCDAEEGCRFEFNTDPCEDGNSCTVDDTCRLGICRGSALSCDDGNVCTSDACDPESTGDNPCVHENLEGPCSDSSACTSGDSCHNGQCSGTQVVCDDGNICTNDSCNPLSGCVYTPNSHSCNDGNACTENDICFNKICRGSPSIYNDGKFCNGTETCDPQSGISLGSAPSCDDGISCTVDSCSDSTNRCEHNPDNSLCDDYNVCTTNMCSASQGCVFQAIGNFNPCDHLPGVEEVCYEGLCTHSCTKHSDCNDGIECTEDNCDFSVGLCRNITRDDVCQDESVCNGQEICNPVIGCTGGEILLCDDGISCTSDYCDEYAGGCMHEESDSICDDNNVCTLDICNGRDGCTHVNINRDCDDGNVCTLGDRCFNGVCSSGSGVLNCDDGNICTSDVCDPLSGCLYSENSSACDDGDPCTEASYCVDGSCQAGVGNCDDGLFCNGQETCNPDGACIQTPAPDCDDGIACTLDECDTGADACVHSPLNDDCNDDNPCTVEYCDAENGCVYEEVEDGTSCSNGYCYQGLCSRPCSQNSDCNDGIECTTDVCDTGVNLCTHSVNHEVCRNNLYCDGEEYCDVLKGCMDGTPVDCEDGLACTVNTCTEEGCISEVTGFCNDGNGCTEDICDENANPLVLPSGCRHNPLNGEECSDGSSCTVDDVCVQGICSGTVKNCDDDNPCTANYCGKDGECHSVQLSNGTRCGNGLVCLWGVCVSGCASDSDCVGADDVDCTVELCSPESFHCVSVAVDEFCDNGLFCDGEEYCDEASGCMAGTPVDCDDGISCSIDTCDEYGYVCRHTPNDAYCNDNDPCVEGYCSLASDCVFSNTDHLCSDGNPCTGNDRCSGGVCSGSLSAVTCNDGNACTADSCDSEAGCLHVDISDQCDDGNSCTYDYCSPVAGCRSRAVESMACDDGNACTDVDYCDNGRCVSLMSLDCDDKNPCTEDSCNSAGGCANTYNGDGAECDLGIMLEGEVCHGGICTTSCLNDVDCEDYIDCTQDACHGGFCVHTPQNSVCDDGIYCNGGEVCIPGYGCGIGQKPSCDDSVECTRDWCDTELDECVNMLTDEICDDGNPCTADTCSAGGCDNVPLSDIGCDDDNICTVNDSCSDGVCSGQVRVCDDYNDCTGPDSCDTEKGCLYPALEDGVECGPESGMTCRGGFCTSSCNYDYQCDDGVDCTFDACDRISHICRYSPQNSRCDDGLFCNGIEICNATLGCIDAAANPCDDLIFCTDDSCDEENNKCEHAAVNSRCDDFNECTTQSCQVGTGCSYAVNTGAECDDGDPCTSVSQCSSTGQCVGKALLNCDTGDDCRPGNCETGLGCVDKISPDGTPCNETDSCAHGSQCISGQCVTDQYYFCDDNKECTINTCNDDGCVFYPIIQPLPCDDGLRCTTGEYCYARECNSVPVSCDDGNFCTADSCSEENGCSHVPANEGQNCPLSKSRALLGVCSNGACVGSCSGVGDCDDHIECTIDSCEGNLCRHVPDHALCDDGEYCNGAELCVVGQGCVDNIPVECGDAIECTSDSCDEESDTCINDPASSNCDDGNPCTVDACDPALGCTHQPLDGVGCDDGNVCTLGGVCVNGFCASRQAMHCDDGNPCTSDLCDADEGCVFQPLSGPDCSDGNLCTTQDTCLGGVCVGVAATCDDGNQCTYDYCDASIGCVNKPLTAVICDDGNACTEEDHCFKGKCNGYEQIECDDGDPCTYNRCSPDVGCVYPAVQSEECKK